MSTHAENPKRITLREIQALYQSGEKITMLTAYDAVMAEILDLAGVELLLVGDSLGNVVLGYETTLPVKLDDMIRHTAAVVRGSKRALVICDLPFGTTTDPETALRASVRVFQETSCQAVKIEGGLKATATVKRLVAEGIPVMGHIGLVPQSIHQLGGYYLHGKTKENVNYLIESAKELEAAGAFSIVLECIIPEVAAEITSSIAIPTIGIGAGIECSGQVLVINDLIGLGVKPPPKFALPKAQVAQLIQKAVKEFISEVKSEGKLNDTLAVPGYRQHPHRSRTL